jgi:polysaccharide chain length determinant protein (PEP-CTERM system associated)
MWILRKRKWLIIGPAFLFTVTAIWVSLALPDRYRSSTLILVVPQRVPENYVRPAISETIEQRLLSISPQILSESRLERIINELDLYPEQRKQETRESVIADMRGDITVDIIKGDLFRVTYEGDSPYKVMQVTQRLASLFVEENLKDRERLAVGTNQFLEQQVEEVRKRLEELETRAREYRERHAGQLPSQMPANLQMLQSSTLQLQALEDSLARDRERRLDLEHSLNELRVLDATAKQSATETQAEPKVAVVAPPVIPETGAGPAASIPVGPGQLQAAKQELARLELRYKPSHPDIIRLKSLIAEISGSAGASTEPNGEGTRDPAAVSREMRINQLAAQLNALNNEMARKTAEQTRLTEVVADYRGRVESEPALESEFIAITRDYDTQRELYRTLLAKKGESGISANLERQQVSQQFRTLDAARLPELPSGPNRPLLNLIAAVMGIGLGLGLTIVLELRDQSFRTGAEIAGVLAVPVLAMVPAMVGRYELRRRNRRMAVSVGILFLAAAVGAGYYFFRGWL